MTNKVDEFEFFLTKPWSDGLPVVTPTKERIERMLQGTHRAPDELLGYIPLTMGPATVESVATHAVMAGCTPEYLPVLLGAIPIMLREEFNLNGVQATLGSVAPLMIVNGPYARQIGLNGSNGCFGPGFRANATIGRAIRLMLLNLGGGIPGVGSATVFATPMRYTACLTETENSPWESLAESRGYKPEDNVITFAMVESPRVYYDNVSSEPDSLLIGIADSLSGMGTFNMLRANSNAVVAMSPEHANICTKAGMSRSDVHNRISEFAGRKLSDLKRGGPWANPEFLVKGGYSENEEDFFVRAIKDPSQLHLIVAGGVGPQTAVCLGWGSSSFAVHGQYSV